MRTLALQNQGDEASRIGRLKHCFFGKTMKKSMGRKNRWAGYTPAHFRRLRLSEPLLVRRNDVETISAGRSLGSVVRRLDGPGPDGSGSADVQRCVLLLGDRDADDEMQRQRPPGHLRQLVPAAHLPVGAPF